MGARESCRAAAPFFAPALVHAGDSSDCLAPQAPLCCTFSSPASEVPSHPGEEPIAPSLVLYSPPSGGSFTLPLPGAASVCLAVSPFLCSPKGVCSCPYLPPQTSPLGDIHGELSHMLTSAVLLFPYPASQCGFCSYFCCVLYSPYVTLDYDGGRE